LPIAIDRRDRDLYLFKRKLGSREIPSEIRIATRVPFLLSRVCSRITPQPFVFQTRAVCTHLLSLQRVMQRARRLIAITRSFTRAPAHMQNAERACAIDFHPRGKRSHADVHGFQLAASSESERRRHVEIFARARPARSVLPLPRSFQSKREKLSDMPGNHEKISLCWNAVGNGWKSGRGRRNASSTCQREIRMVSSDPIASGTQSSRNRAIRPI